MNPAGWWTRKSRGRCCSERSGNPDYCESPVLSIDNSFNIHLFGSVHSADQRRYLGVDEAVECSVETHPHHHGIFGTVDIQRLDLRHLPCGHLRHQRHLSCGQLQRPRWELQRPRRDEIVRRRHIHNRRRHIHNRRRRFFQQLKRFQQFDQHRWVSGRADDCESNSKIFWPLTSF